MPQEKKSRSKKIASSSGETSEIPSGMINIKSEDDKTINELSNRENVALIAFIAPYVSVRISPIEEAHASISLPDEFGIEALVEELKITDIKKAYLLVNSPGGRLDSSYKIARAIRRCFDEITTFVPHVAASGGTLLTLTGNQIVMGPMSHITPLDVQIPYKGTYISAATFTRFFTRASHWFERITSDEAPYPQRAMADKLDPFIMEEWGGFMNAAINYVEDIITLAGYKESTEIAKNLVMSFPTHGYVINSETAKEIGLNIKDSSEFHQTWDTMRHWLSKYIFEQEITHFIRYVLPTQNQKSLNKKSINDEKK